MSDAIRRDRTEPATERFPPWRPAVGYNGHVDGMAHTWMAPARFAALGASPPRGAAQDPPGMAWMHGPGHPKNEQVVRPVAGDGIDAPDGSLKQRQRGALGVVVSEASALGDALAGATAASAAASSPVPGVKPAGQVGALRAGADVDVMTGLADLLDNR